MIFARGLSASLLASSFDVRTKALAPSLILLAFAAVIVPLGKNKGFSLGIFSGMNFLSSSSSNIFVISPFLPWTGTYTISPSNIFFWMS